MSVISELVGRLPSLRQKSVPIAQTRSESANTIVELITAVPGSPALTSGTQGEALGGGWTVPTATVRIFCNVLVVKGLMQATRFSRLFVYLTGDRPNTKHILEKESLRIFAVFARSDLS